ncbi:putative ribonuclease H-like domain-containing protein [Tanacetum coccineum]
MKSGLVSINTARQNISKTAVSVNNAHSKTIVNDGIPMSYLSKTAHSTIKRPIYKNTIFKNSNFNQRVNTVKDKNVNIVMPKAVANAARPKAVVNVVKGNNVNAVKASACWVWKPNTKVLDHGNQQMDLQDKRVIDSGCLRHMTWNMSYLTDYEEIDGGYVAFGGNPKGEKIIGKATKDETSGILKSFITGIKKLVDHKVKHRTPQQNGVAERRNRILIEAARTMLADSKLPTTFWAEAVNTACYVQNRVLVVKPHNKTPYELFHGKTPTLSFMRPFRCLVTILNTIDHLGKFDGKADEGFFVGYSLNSKAFRVFNSRTRIVEENLHIRFSENTPNVIGSGPDWLFDIDALTRTMNYKPIVAGTQSNGFASTKVSDNEGQARKGIKPVKNYILLPLWPADLPFSQDPKCSQNDGSKPSSDDEKKVDKDPRKDSESINQEKDDNVNSTNNVNAASTNKVNVVGGKTSIELPDDPNMPALEDISIFDLSRDNEDRWNKKDEKGIVIRNKERLVAQGYTQEEGIDYNEVFALVAKIEAIRIFLAYASFKDFVVYQMDVKNAFLYGKIEEEVYVCQPPGFEDPDFPNRVYKAEAVNTACYVQNRVLVVKPHNKTLYELFHGRTPTLSFMRPFGCPVTILNTIDHLGKFDGKADEGFFVGYSLNSKAFRVFNSRTRIVEENLHIRFSENTPNVVGTKASDNAGQARKETEPVKNYILLPLWPADPPFSQDPKSSQDDGSKPSSDDEKKVDEDPRKDSESIDQEKDDNVNSTNNVNVASINEVNVVGGKISIKLPDDPNMPALEDISIFDLSSDNEDVGAEADMNNLDTTIQEEPKKVIHALKDPSWIKAIQEELLQFKLQEVWTLVELPNGKRSIGTKWVFRNKKDERGIMIRNKSRLVARGYTQEKGIYYDEVFAPVARIEAIRLFLAYASFKDFVVYQMDIKSAFLYGKIKEEVYVCQPPRFEDPDFPNRVYKVEKALYGLHQAPRAWYETLSTYLLDNEFQRGKIDKTLFIKRYKGDILLMSSMGELTFFLGLQVQQKKDGIFISQDKYVGDILKKFGFTEVKTASTPIETQKPLLKDEDGEEVDVHMYRSMIGSLMYLTSSRPDIMFAVCACARYQVNPKVSHLHAVKRIFRYLKGQPKLGLWYPKDSPFDLVAYTNSDYAGASLDRKSTTGGCQFLGSRLISWQCKKQTVVANSTTEAEYVAASSCCGQVLWIQNQLLDYGDCNEKKLIQMVKIYTDKNVADLLTKAFDLLLLGYLLLLVMVNAVEGIFINTSIKGFNHSFDRFHTFVYSLFTNPNSVHHSSSKPNTMTTLKFADTHNMVVFLAKPAESEGFKQIVDFLNAHTIKYELTINPTIYTSCIEQFWATVKAKIVNGEVQLQTLVDGKKIIITESIVRRDLQLEDAEGVDCLPNATIFEQLTLMGYEKISQKLTLYKAFFSPQWKFLIHTILHCQSSKTTACNKFSRTMASAIICLATNQKFNFSRYIFESMVKNLDNVGKFLMYPRFVQVFVNQQLDGLPSHKRIYVTPSHTKKIFRNMKRVGKGFSGRVTPLFPTMVVHNQEEMGEADETANEEIDDSLVRDATTASSLEAEQDSSNINKTQSKATPNEPSSPGTSSGGVPRRQETIGDTIAQTRSENVSKLSNDPLLARVLNLEITKTTQANEIASLKRRVKKLEKKNKSRIHKLKRLYKVGLSARVESSGDEESLGEDASKQGKMITDIDDDEDIYLINVHIYEDMFGVNDLDGDEVIVESVDVVNTAKETRSVVEEVTAVTIPVSAATTTTTTTAITDVEMTLAQALTELKSAKPKATIITTTPTLTTTTAAITITVVSTQQLQLLAQDPKQKGLLFMNMSKHLHQQFLHSNHHMSRFRTMAKIDADYQLAQRLQAQEQDELTNEEKARFVCIILRIKKKTFCS